MVDIVPTSLRSGPPRRLDAMVLEDDTHLVLGADEQVADGAGEDPVRLIDEAVAFDPWEVGSVVAAAGEPLRLLAVVHDLDMEPTWRAEWVARAVAGVLREAEARGLVAIGMPVLGSVHGSMAVAEFAAILREELERADPATLETIWVVLPPGARPEDGAW